MHTRNYSVRMGEIIVGRSALEEEVEPGTVRRGAFRAGLGWQLVEPVFELRPAAAAAATAGASDESARGDRYERARDALKLRLVDESGSTVPTRRIEIIRAEGKEREGALLLEVELG